MNGVAGRQCIHALKARAARKVPRSLSYRKLQKTYYHRVGEDIKHELQSRYITGSKADILLYPATKRLEQELGIGATQGIMPDFSDETALFGYSLQHFGRTRLLFDLITQTQPDWLESRVRELFYTRSNSGGIVSRSPCIDLISLGGGPGYDYITAAILSEFCSGLDMRVKAQIFDYETNWESIVHSVENATQKILGHDRHTCTFGRCDITQQLSDVTNVEVSLDGHIYTCSYCIHENAVALRNGNWSFFRDLFEEADDGSLFFFTDTTHRLWPELAEVAKDSRLRYSTPRICSGKSGWQFVAFKDVRHPGDIYYNTAISRELLQRFKTDNDAHLSKLKKAIQIRKV